MTNDAEHDIRHETKMVYVKRWRTLVRLPAKYADEIVAALRIPDDAQTVWMPIATAPKGPTISVARRGGQRDDGSTYWYQAIGHYDPNLGHFHKSYGELYGEPELWAQYPENPERCAAQPPAAPVGFFAGLTPGQQKAALEYRGPENHGDPAYARSSAAAPVEVDPASTFTDKEWHDALMGDPHPRSSVGNEYVAKGGSPAVAAHIRSMTRGADEAPDDYVERAVLNQEAAQFRAEIDNLKEEIAQLRTEPQASPDSAIADALERCDWANVSIGNKAVIRAAVVALRAQPQTPKEPCDGADDLEHLDGMLDDRERG